MAASTISAGNSRAARRHPPLSASNCTCKRHVPLAGVPAGFQRRLVQPAAAAGISPATTKTVRSERSSVLPSFSHRFLPLPSSGHANTSSGGLSGHLTCTAMVTDAAGPQPPCAGRSPTLFGATTSQCGCRFLHPEANARTATRSSRRQLAMKSRLALAASMLLLTVGLSACGTPRTHVAGPAYWPPEPAQSAPGSDLYPSQYAPTD